MRGGTASLSLPQPYQKGCRTCVRQVGHFCSNAEPTAVVTPHSCMSRSGGGSSKATWCAGAAVIAQAERGFCHGALSCAPASPPTLPTRTGCPLTPLLGTCCIKTMQRFAGVAAVVVAVVFTAVFTAATPCVCALPHCGCSSASVAALHIHPCNRGVCAEHLGSAGGGASLRKQAAKKPVFLLKAGSLAAGRRSSLHCLCVDRSEVVLRDEAPSSA